MTPSARGIRGLSYRGLTASYTGTRTLGTRLSVWSAADDHLRRFAYRRVPIVRRRSDRRLHCSVIKHRQSNDRSPAHLRWSGSDQFEQRSQRRLIADRSERCDRGLPRRPITVVRREFDEPRNGRCITQFSICRCDGFHHARVVVVTPARQSVIAAFSGAAECFGGHRSDSTVLVVGDDAAKLRNRIGAETGGNTD